jgi:hypothetical protein
MIHARINSKGQFTFIDAYFDAEEQNRMLDVIAAKVGQAFAPPATAPPHLPE